MSILWWVIILVLAVTGALLRLEPALAALHLSGAGGRRVLAVAAHVLQWIHLSAPLWRYAALLR